MTTSGVQNWQWSLQTFYNGQTHCDECVRRSQSDHSLLQRRQNGQVTPCMTSITERCRRGQQNNSVFQTTCHVSRRASDDDDQSTDARDTRSITFLNDEPDVPGWIIERSLLAERRMRYSTDSVVSDESNKNYYK